MENNNKQYLSYALRGIISVLFLVSSVAKLYPSPHFAITTFEMKQLLPMGFSEGVAMFLSRTLIGVEFALGFLILQPHYLRKIVIPATIALLAVFIAQLGIEICMNGNAGNCGCFGELLPMTPAEAIAKNVLAIAILIWLLALQKNTPDKRNIWVLVGVTALCIAGVVGVVEATKGNSQTGVVVYDDPATEAVSSTDTVTVATDRSIESPAVASEAPATANAPAPEARPTEPAKADGPKPIKSAYSKYFPQADQGKKIIAFFAPGCEHCRDTAKQLTEMKAKDKDFPELYIIFMDEEANLIPDFFTFAGKKYPYTVLDVGTFWKMLGMTKDTPSVIYQWNGNLVKEWEGINANKFNAAELQKALKK